MKNAAGQIVRGLIMSQRNKVEVRIAGKDYKLVGVDSDEHIQKIGLYVF